MSLNGSVSSEDTKVLRGKIRHVPVIDKTLLKPNQCAEAKATGDALEARVKKADIVDSLTSDAADKPLSARQGAELKKQLDELASKLEG